VSFPPVRWKGEEGKSGVIGERGGKDDAAEDIVSDYTANEGGGDTRAGAQPAGMERVSSELTAARTRICPERSWDGKREMTGS